MATGRVKWFNNAKGYGFILPDNGGCDLFAHYTSIQMEGYRTLKAGQPVTFEVIDGDKGSHAVKIAPVLESTSVDSGKATSTNSEAFDQTDQATPATDPPLQTTPLEAV